MLVAIKRCGVDGGSGVYGRHFLIFSPKKVVSCRKERVKCKFWSVFLVGITNLAGTPFFRKRGASCIKKGASASFFLKKGASAPFLREKGVPVKKMIPKCTDQDFLWYSYGKYQEILTNTDRKIPIPYTTLDFTLMCQV